MPTLSRLFLPFSRLSLLRRAPFWAQALALCALFAIVGVAVLDDYGVTADEFIHRRTAATVAGYALGVSEELPIKNDRYYGVAFLTPLLLAERALELQDSRHIYLTRHLLTHLFFIAGGFVCGMLAYRMVGSRWIALLVMLLFMLHPRLYAHSFFNVKDIPFAVMFVAALYLAYRAFRKDTFGAFLLCGIGVGLAINLRVFALMLLPLILAMRALDMWQAGGEERKRILASAGIFAAAALATMYIVHPYYWENPLRFIEGIRVLSQHPTISKSLFMGEIYPSDAVPWNYIPVWFAITAPPVTLALGAFGVVSVCWQGVSRPLAALRDREIRFRILLLGCIALPVAAAFILQSHLSQGWRHMYFLWGPFCLLAAVGLSALASGGAAKAAARGVAARLPGWVRGGGRLRMAQRALAYGIAGVGLITTLTAMAALHPYQYVYFNALTDIKMPGALAKRYDMDYWLLAQRQSLERLLALYPDDTLRVWMTNSNKHILPQDDRERILVSRNLNSADYYIHRERLQEAPILHAIEAYDSVLAYIFAPKNLEAHRAAYADVAANGTLLTRSVFDIYIHNGTLHYLNANCASQTDGLNLRVFLHIFPADPADLPSDSREHGFENRRFRLNQHASFFDGKCIVRRQLPNYPIARIATGYEGDRVEWRADIDLADPLYARIAAGDYGLPVAQSDFDVYLRDGVLAYLKEPCAAGDTDAWFFLHIFPADPTDLPADMREYGFANLDFRFGDRGGRIGDICVASRELPGYAIERIRTGQFIRGEGNVWSAEFAAGR